MGRLLGAVLGRASPPRASNELQPSATLRWVSARREGLIFAALGVLVFALTIYMCAPGYMGPDSRSQFQQARDFSFTDDHPVLMVLVWHYLDRVLPGPLGMLVFTNALYWAGLSALFYLLPGALVWRVLGFLALAFFPPGLSFLPVVYKDPLMHGALLAGIACVVPNGRRALAPRLALGVVCFLLAVGVRHNGAAAVWPFLALPVMRLPFIARLRPWLRLFVGCALGLLLAFVMTQALDRALAPLARATEFWQTVPVYDLAGMSVQAQELLVDRDSPVLGEGMGLKEIEQRFDVIYGGSLYRCVPTRRRGCVPLFHFTLNRAELARLSQNWLSAIARHPGAYLAHRWELTRRMLTVNLTGWEMYFTSTAPHGEFAKQYPPSARLRWVLAFMERHIRSVAYTPWIYVILSFVLLPFALLRYLREGAPLPLLFLFSGGAYLLSILVGANSTEFRYCVWTMLCTLLAFAFTLRPRQRREPALAAASAP
jgi:hypothetical protein